MSHYTRQGHWWNGAHLLNNYRRFKSWWSRTSEKGNTPEVFSPVPLRVKAPAQLHPRLPSFLIQVLSKPSVLSRIITIHGDSHQAHVLSNVLLHPSFRHPGSTTSSSFTRYEKIARSESNINTDMCEQEVSQEERCINKQSNGWKVTFLLLVSGWVCP